MEGSVDLFEELAEELDAALELVGPLWKRSAEAYCLGLSS